MWKPGLLLLTLGLIGCSTQEPQAACGESFCLPSTAELIDKRTPVEDFSLYRVEWGGIRFGIYEGNQPQDLPGASRTGIRLPIDATADLRVAGGRGSLLIKVTECRADELCWPRYLDVSGPCETSARCPLQDFASQLSRRR